MSGKRKMHDRPARGAGLVGKAPLLGITVHMLTILLIVLLVVLLLGGIGGPRYYRGRVGRRRTIVREYEDI